MLSFTSNTESAHFECNCGHTWKAPARFVASGRSGCPRCSRRERLTPETFQQRLDSIHGGGIIALTPFKNMVSRLRFRHLVCGFEWEGSPIGVSSAGRSATGCPQCGALKAANNYSGYKVKEVVVGNRTFKLRGYEPFALQFMREHRGIKSKDIQCGDASMPYFQYQEFGKKRTYIPDFYVSSQHRIVEVKSVYTMVGRTAWYNNLCRKRRSVLREGYRFSLMVFDGDGRRLKLPSDWYAMGARALRKCLKHPQFH